MNTSLSTKKISLLYFLIPLLIQLLIIISVPSKSFYTYKTGQDVTIQTIPVDPYDLLRGYSQTLRYEISSLRNLKDISGTKDLKKGETFYITLQAPDSLEKRPPSPWKPVAIDKYKPATLPANQIALKGTVNKYNRLEYGLETYYMPENRRNKINQDIRNLRNLDNERRSFVVEIKVDRFGNSIPYSLWIGDDNYRF